MDDDCTQAEFSQVDVNITDVIEMHDSCTSITSDTPSKKRALLWSSDASSRSATKKARNTPVPTTPVVNTKVLPKVTSDSSDASSPTLSPVHKPQTPNVHTPVPANSDFEVLHVYEDLFQIMEKTLNAFADKDMMKIRQELIGYHRSLFLQRASGQSVDTRAAKLKLLESFKHIVVNM